MTQSRLHLPWAPLLASATSDLKRSRSLPAWISALAFVFSVVASSKIHWSGNLFGSLALNYMGDFAWPDIVLLVVATPIVAFLLLLAEKVIRALSEGTAPADRREAGMQPQPWWIGASTLLLLVCWSPYLLVYAPGSILGDTLGSLVQSPGHWNNHYPIVFTLMLKAFAAAGIRTGDINRGVFAYAFVQTLVLAVALASSIYYLARRGAALWWCGLALAYFALVPVFGVYAIGLQKDLLFSLAVAVLSLVVFGIVASEGQAAGRVSVIAAFIAACTAVIFLRNNGMYVVAGTALLLLAAYRRGALRLVAATAVLVALALAIQGPGYRALHVGSDALVESAGVPLQQMAYVTDTKGAMSSAQREFVGRLLPEAQWAAVYTPCIVDPVKLASGFDRHYLNTHTQRFFATWAAIVLHNPAPAWKAYCLETFGFWTLGVNNTYGFADTYVHRNSLGIVPFDAMKRLTGVSLKPFLDGLRGPTGTGGFLGSGTLLWLVVLGTVLAALSPRPQYALVSVPSLLVWATIMIATPVAFSLRYVFAFAICLPAILALPFAAYLPSTRRLES
jgi:hypothetical protein